MCHHPHLPCAGIEFLKTQDTSHHLHERHVAGEFTHGVHLRTVHVFVGVVHEQVAESLDAEFLTQHFLALLAYPRQIHDILFENVHRFVHLLWIPPAVGEPDGGCQRLSNCLSEKRELAAIASAITKSKGVVILMFSWLPSTSVMLCP